MRNRDAGARLVLAVFLAVVIALLIALGATAQIARGAAPPLVPAPPVVVSETACPGGLACTEGNVVYVRPFAAIPEVIKHEEGHVFDFRYLDPGERTQFLQLISHTAFEWWGDDYDHSGGEWFADAYIRCALVQKIRSWWPYSVGSGLVAGWRLRGVCHSLWVWAA